MNSAKKTKRESEYLLFQINPRILIVEDENIIAMDLQIIQESFGFDVCSVVSYGEESVRIASASQPDLVLMDVKLRGKMTGIEAVKEIHGNLEHLKTYYKGNVLFWSTLREDQSLLSCFEEFMFLYEANLVSHMFWHWAESRRSFRDLPVYAKRYADDFERIMHVYTDGIHTGDIIPLTHVNELVLYLLTGKKRGHTACGAELAKNYEIVSGKVYPCADLPYEKAIGHLNPDGRLHIQELNLAKLVEYKDQLGCFLCGVHPYCGGRCPVQALAGSQERTHQICQLRRLHVGLVQERMDDIIEGIKDHNISPQDIYGRAAFLARYTDVVP